jgi:uncharacterized membrane protein YeaQ/YmgE (transglycosylase-associated protein family)
MFTVLSWCFYGLIIGALAKLLMPGKQGSDILPTILVGIAGSVLGGLISFILNLGASPFSPAGILISVVCAVLALWAWSNRTQ